MFHLIYRLHALLNIMYFRESFLEICTQACTEYLNIGFFGLALLLHEQLW